MKNKKFKLEFSSETAKLEEVRRFISELAKKMGFEQEDLEKIELAVDEACSNIIKHAYNYQKDKMIDLLVKTEKDKIVIIIEDSGEGFSPDNVELPNMEVYVKKLQVGGLGMYLMKTLMDEVSYEINPGIKNKVRMVKYL